MPPRHATKKTTTTRKRTAVSRARNVDKYEHPKKTRLNNPPVGLVTRETDPDYPKKAYAYDPHLDPRLIWSGKDEKADLTIDTVSLHVHERVDPLTIIEAVRNRASFVEQPSLFEKPSENPPLREAIDFYKHSHEWSNRLIAGDSALVMNSLLEREGMAGQIQMVYVDPPYGIKYGSNFQPFVNRRDVKDGKDDDLTQEPEMIRAFRDTWELGIHSWLAYLRDRLLLSRELMAPSASCFVQISDENLHLVRNLMDEVFCAANFVSLIAFAKTSGATEKYLSGTTDYIVWYARDIAKLKYRPLFREKKFEADGPYNRVELPDKTRRPMTAEEKQNPETLPVGARIYRLDNLTSQSVGREKGEGAACWFAVELNGREYRPTYQSRWKTNEAGMGKLKESNRLDSTTNGLYYVRYLDDFAAYQLNNSWSDTVIAGFTSDKRYVVETSTKVVERCLLMTTDPGDVVLDPTCGSGTTAFVAEEWGRRWITCDTSRVAVTLAKQRLLTAVYEYYELQKPEEGVDSGFRYQTIPRTTLKSITTGEKPDDVTLYDLPFASKDKVRVTGPLTVEAVPAPMVTALTPAADGEPDASIGHSGATARESDWREELLKTGVRGLGGKTIRFSRVEPLAGTTFLQAEAETIEDKPRRAVISFGPDYAPLEQRQVEGAWKEAQTLNPAPAMLLFAAFQFDPEAAKDIDEMNPRLAKMTFLKVQMNTDLLTSDLKKKRATNESFWLIGRPDVEQRTIDTGENKGKHVVEVHGFDYYDVRTGEIVSGNASKIAMWMLDPDYDGRSLFPRQVFFPMAGEKEGWSRLAKSLKAEIDENLIEAYRGTVSLPFEPGKHQRVAVKIIDDRGVESMRVLQLT